MLEVELKYEIESISALAKKLDVFGSGETSIYFDRYFDDEVGSLTRNEGELRVREIVESGGEVSRFLTAKSAPVENSNKNKMEYEIVIDSSESAILILKVIGFRQVVELQKKCCNYHFNFDSYSVVCTLVELVGFRRYFVEMEILTERTRYKEATDCLYELARKLELDDSNRTSEYYTDIVLAKS